MPVRPRHPARPPRTEIQPSNSCAEWNVGHREQGARDSRPSGQAAPAECCYRPHGPAARTPPAALATPRDRQRNGLGAISAQAIEGCRKESGATRRDPHRIEWPPICGSCSQHSPLHRATCPCSSLMWPLNLLPVSFLNGSKNDDSGCGQRDEETAHGSERPTGWLAPFRPTPPSFSSSRTASHPLTCSIFQDASPDQQFIKLLPVSICIFITIAFWHQPIPWRYLKMSGTMNPPR